jgi:Isochorismatase family
MAPLLRPSECSVLIVDALNSQDSEFTVIANRDRVLEAASMCGIPSFVALYLHDPTTGEPTNLSESARYYSFPAIGVLWQDSAFGRALAQTGRSSVLLCGHWLEEYITFAAIKALSEGYDAYILADASPTRDGNAREMALLRLVQAGVVPTTTRQVIREWAADFSDTTYMNRLLALL